MGKKSKPRIFVGIREIGDFTLRFAQGFRELGFETTNIVFETNNPLLQRHDKHDEYIKAGNKYLRFSRLLGVFLRNSFCHDIFIFNFSESFFGYLLNSRRKYLNWLGYFDLPLLKLMGKKIVVLTAGCDVRHYTLSEKQARDDGLKYCACAECNHRDTCSLILKKERVRKIEKYADYIFSDPECGSLFRRDFKRGRALINLKTIYYRVNNEPEPLIIHAPSDSAIKGSKYVLRAIEKLREEGYSFRFLLCRNMENEEVRRKLAESEIVVDALLRPSHGLFAIEAMASGNVVLGGAIPGRYGFPEELPIITTTPDNIYDNLKMVLENPRLRIDRARRGRAYVEKYHDHVKVARYFLEQIGEGEHL